MKLSSISTFFCVAGLATMVLGLQSTGEASAPKVTYKDVKTLLDTKCVKCHNDKRAAEGVDLSSYAAIIKGDKGGKAILVAGKAKESRLITYVDGTKKPQMPLGPGAVPLTPKEVTLLKTWITDGAK